MSQAGTNNENISPPSVPTQFTSLDDASVAVPVANNLNVGGGYVEDNNDNGIQVVADPNGEDDLYVQLTNRYMFTTTTTDDVNNNIGTITLTTAGIYLFEASFCAYNTTDTLGATYKTFIGVRTNGTNSVTRLQQADKIINEESTMIPCDVNFTFSSNSLVFRVKGLSEKTINWKCIGTYMFVGA